MLPLDSRRWGFNKNRQCLDGGADSQFTNITVADADGCEFE